MPERKIARMSGVNPSHVKSHLDHTPQNEVVAPETLRQFLKEEQKEGMHPSLKGKHF